MEHLSVNWSCSKLLRSAQMCPNWSSSIHFGICIRWLLGLTLIRAAIGDNRDRGTQIRRAALCELETTVQSCSGLLSPCQVCFRYLHHSREVCFIYISTTAQSYTFKTFKFWKERLHKCV